MRRSMKQLAALAFALCLPALALADEAAEHGAGHGEHGWDTQALVASIVNFGILLVVFTVLFRGKLQEFLKERRASIARELEEAARLRAEAETKHKEYSERLAKLDQELAQIKADMIAAGKKERDRIVAEAEHKAARLRHEAEFLIEQQAKQLRLDLMREATEGAVAAAEQLLLRATTTYDQQRLAQEYLALLTSKRPSSPPSTPPKRPSNSIHTESRP